MDDYTEDQQEMMHEINDLSLKYDYRVVIDEEGAFLHNGKEMIFMSDFWRFKNGQVIDIIDSFDIEIMYDEAENVLESQGSVNGAIVEIRKLRS